MVQTTKLENGLTDVTEDVPYVQSVSLGIWYNVGSRQEDDHNNGISHFIEHMMFKGTEKRTALEIAQELDFVGGQLNAGTDKEYTCYFAKVLSEHLPVAADVLSDMCLNSLFDPEELSREKNVVLEEIKRYQDTPDELVHDLFVQNLFADHPLGRPVIGTPETVSALEREDILSYMDRWYQPDRTYVVAAGDVRHEDIMSLFGESFGARKGKASPMPKVATPGAKSDSRYERTTEQVHFCMGKKGPDQYDESKYALAVMDAAMGGGMSSRLFQEIREKRGLAYSVGSYPHSYSEMGLYAIYAGTSPETLDEVLDLCRQEAGKVRAEGLNVEEFQRAKNQIKGALLLSLESTSSRMSRMAKSQMYFDRVIPMDEIVEKVMAVTHEDVRAAADRVLDQDDWSLTLIGPEHGLPE
jgi:predicted Zn-dependent peptidase